MPQYAAPTSRAHNVLTRRLADRHDMPLLRAHFAVRRAALGIADEHTELVHAETNALLIAHSTAVTTHLAAPIRDLASIGPDAQQPATRPARPCRSGRTPVPTRTTTRR
jgi:hypothetical protein